MPAEKHEARHRVGRQHAGGAARERSDKMGYGDLVADGNSSDLGWLSSPERPPRKRSGASLFAAQRAADWRLPEQALAQRAVIVPEREIAVRVGRVFGTAE